MVPLCVRLQQQSHCVLEVGTVSGQYGSPSPRRELYRLLLALVLVPSPRWPPPLSCAVSAFSHGRRDHDIMVREHLWLKLFSEFCCPNHFFNWSQSVFIGVWSQFPSNAIRWSSKITLCSSSHCQMNVQFHKQKVTRFMFRIFLSFWKTLFLYLVIMHIHL